jgi:hypothetical protein
MGISRLETSVLDGHTVVTENRNPVNLIEGAWNTYGTDWTM